MGRERQKGRGDGTRGVHLIRVSLMMISGYCLLRRWAVPRDRILSGRTYTVKPMDEKFDVNLRLYCHDINLLDNPGQAQLPEMRPFPGHY